MLDNLALVVEAEIVHPSVFLESRPLLVAVKDDEVALGDGSFELHSLAWVLSDHPVEVVHERLFPVGNFGVVLGVVEQLDDLLAGLDVALTYEILDRIDKIVPPGTDVGTLDQAYRRPALQRSDCRRPIDERAA